MLTLTRIKATDLVPGTIVRDETGARLFAAFDVDWHGPAEAPVVRIWTAIRDQDAGQPAQITMPADADLFVA